MKAPLYQIIESGCWIWLGRRDSRGTYGLGRRTTAHREVYSAYRGEIPEGLELDHLCLTTLCVNPDHLEPVTPEENRRRRYALITECVNGHLYDELNTYWRPNGQRDCRACIRVRVRSYKRRKRDAA